MENKKAKTIDKIKFILLIILILGGALIILKNYDYIKNLNVDKVIDFIKNKGEYSAIIYLSLYILKPFFFIIPTNIMVIGSGLIFGPLKGFCLTMIGFFISGTVAFYVARLLGKSFIEGILGNRFLKLDDNIEKNGFRILFLLRLPPILPYDPLSYACGLTKIKYKDFILASLLGVVPETICYSIMGKSITNPLSPEFIIPVILLLFGVIFSKKIMDKKNEKDNKNNKENEKIKKVS